MTSSAEHPVSKPAPRVGRTQLADQFRLKGFADFVEYEGLRAFRQKGPIGSERSGVGGEDLGGYGG